MALYIHFQVVGLGISEPSTVCVYVSFPGGNLATHRDKCDILRGFPKLKPFVLRHPEGSKNLWKRTHFFVHDLEAIKIASYES